MNRLLNELMQIQVLFLQISREMLELDDMVMRFSPKKCPKEEWAPEVWMRQWHRGLEGMDQYHNLIVELCETDQSAFSNFMYWMSQDLFSEIERCLTPDLQRKRTFFREPLSPILKLAMTLKHLATGESGAFDHILPHPLGL